MAMTAIADRVTSWTQSITSSHRAQLITTAVASGALVGVSILSFQTAKYQARKKLLKVGIDDDHGERDSIADQVGSS